MMQITDVILIALFIEAVVNTLKPIWSKDGESFSISEYVSMGMGVLLAVACRMNMLDYVVYYVDYPAWVEYVFYVLTGIAIGRGTNFVYDLWGKLKAWQGGTPVEATDKSLNEATEKNFLKATQLEEDMAMVDAGLLDDVDDVEDVEDAETEK